MKKLRWNEISPAWFTAESFLLSVWSSRFVTEQRRENVGVVTPHRQAGGCWRHGSVLLSFTKTHLQSVQIRTKTDNNVQNRKYDKQILCSFLQLAGSLMNQWRGTITFLLCPHEMNSGLFLPCKGGIKDKICQNSNKQGLDLVDQIKWNNRTQDIRVYLITCHTKIIKDCYTKVQCHIKYYSSVCFISVIRVHGRWTLCFKPFVWSDRRTGSEEKDKVADFTFGLIFSRNENDYWDQDVVKRKPDTSVHACEQLAAFCNAEKCLNTYSKSPKHENVYLRLTWHPPPSEKGCPFEQPEKRGNNLWINSFSATATKRANI